METVGHSGAINQTTDKINRKIICPSSLTAGCGFSANTGFNNNHTIDSTFIIKKYNRYMSNSSWHFTFLKSYVLFRT